MEDEVTDYSDAPSYFRPFIPICLAVEQAVGDNRAEKKMETGLHSQLKQFNSWERPDVVCI